MSNSGRKMSIPGWCTFVLLGGVLVVAFGALASANPQSESEATLVSAAEKRAPSTLVDQAAAAAVKRKAANSQTEQFSHRVERSPSGLQRFSVGDVPAGVIHAGVSGR